MGDTTVTVSEEPEPVPEPVEEPTTDTSDAAVTAVAETARDAAEASNAKDTAVAAADDASYQAATASENSNVAVGAANQANEALAGIMAAIDNIPGKIAEALQTVLGTSTNASDISASPLPDTNDSNTTSTVEPDSAQHWLNKPLFRKRG